jgi:hypothetical protein
VLGTESKLAPERIGDLVWKTKNDDTESVKAIDEAVELAA